MIQAVTTPAQQAEFVRRIAGKPYFAATMGTCCALFGAHPASGWQFYLLPGQAALTLRGGTATLCGVLPAGEAGEEAVEELQGRLRCCGSLPRRCLYGNCPKAGSCRCRPRRRRN